MSLRQNTSERITIILVDPTTGARKTGRTVASTSISDDKVYLVKASGALSDITLVDTVNWIEIDATNHPGVYQLILGSGDTNVLGQLAWTIRSADMTFLTSTGSDTVLGTAADIAAVKVDTAAIKLKTDLLGTSSVASLSDVTSARDSIKGGQDISSVYSRIGAPVGASISADAAAIKTDTASIKAKTDLIGTSSVSAVSDITAARDSIKGPQSVSISDIAGGVGFVSGTDNLHQVKLAIGTMSGLLPEESVWDEVRSAHITEGTFGEAIRILYQVAQGRVKIDKFENQLIVYEEDGETPLFRCPLLRNSVPASVYSDERAQAL